MGYVLGACNPSLAHQALAIDPSIGLLLPCTVVVRADAGQTIIEAVDPRAMVTITGQPAVQPVADEAASRIRQPSAPCARAAKHAEASCPDVPWRWPAPPPGGRPFC